MLVIASGRKTSRTTQLMYLCDEAENKGEHSRIVCRDKRHADSVEQKARELGLLIRPPLTHDQFYEGTFLRGSQIKNYFIDDLDYFISRFAPPNTIAAVTILREPEVE